MNDLEIIKKYVMPVLCEHCSGEGKCECKKCRDKLQRFASLLTKPAYSPVELNLREEEIKKQREEWKSGTEKIIERQAGTCQFCAGKGKKGFLSFAAWKRCCWFWYFCSSAGMPRHSVLI